MTNKMAAPVEDYTEMIGWPATPPEDRLRKALSFVMDTTEPKRPQQPEHTDQDVLGLLWCHRANMVSSESARKENKAGTSAQRHISSLRMWTEMATKAWGLESEQGFGGIITLAQKSEKNKGTQDSIIFQLLRHPEWMGLNRTLPLMKGLNVVIMESQKMAGRPGMILAGPDPLPGYAGTENLPPGETTLLGEVLRWHAADQILWQRRETMNQVGELGCPPASNH